MDLKKLGTIIRNKREEIGIKPSILAEKTGIPRPTLWIYERGENPKTGKPSRPSKDKLERLAEVLRLNQEETKEFLELADYKATKEKSSTASSVSPAQQGIVQLPPQPASTITEINGTVYFAHDGYLEAFNAKTGERRWSSSAVVSARERTELSVAASNAQTVKTVQDMFPELTPEIKTPMPLIKLIADNEFKCAKGRQSAREIYEEAFRGNEIRACVKVEEVSKLSANNALFFTEAFQKNKKLKMREIIYDSPNSRRAAITLLSQYNEGYSCKFLSNNLWSITSYDILMYDGKVAFINPNNLWSITSYDILMYDDKVAFINYEGEVSCLILQSGTLYHSAKELFDFVWNWDNFIEPTDTSELLG